MPELPDLQVFSLNLTHAFKGRQLQNINVVYAKKLNVPVAILQQALTGQVLNKVIRSGKQLHFVFDNNQILAVHLMLHGELYRFKDSNPHKFTVLELFFEDGEGLVLTDFQKQATPTLNPNPAKAPDALSDEVNFTYLKQQFQQSRAAVKAVLLNQDIMRGIGNAYADEILYDAKISPFSIAKMIPDAQINALAKSIRKVLLNAVQQIQQYKSDIISGEVRDFYKIHRSDQQSTPTGAVIKQKAASSRKTYFTDEQVLYL